MKFKFLKGFLATALLAVSMSMTSCKDKANEAEAGTEEIDTLNGVDDYTTETSYDTIVEDNDTIVKKDNSELDFDAGPKVP